MFGFGSKDEDNKGTLVPVDSDLEARFADAAQESLASSVGLALQLQRGEDLLAQNLTLVERQIALLEEQGDLLNEEAMRLAGELQMHEEALRQVNLTMAANMAALKLLRDGGASTSTAVSPKNARGRPAAAEITQEPSRVDE